MPKQPGEGEHFTNIPNGELAALRRLSATGKDILIEVLRRRRMRQNTVTVWELVSILRRCENAVLRGLRECDAAGLIHQARPGEWAYLAPAKRAGHVPTPKPKRATKAAPEGAQEDAQDRAREGAHADAHEGAKETGENAVQDGENGALNEVERSGKDTTTTSYPVEDCPASAGTAGEAAGQQQHPSPSQAEPERLAPHPAGESQPTATGNTLRGPGVNSVQALSPGVRGAYYGTTNRHNAEAAAARRLLAADPRLLEHLYQVPGGQFSARCLVLDAAVTILGAGVVADLLLEARAGGRDPWALFEHKLRQARHQARERAEREAAVPAGTPGASPDRLGLYRTPNGVTVTLVKESCPGLLDVLTPDGPAFIETDRTVGWEYLGPVNAAGSVNA
ncbi:MAG TPA: hypothetical protein VHN99_01165 [Deinococcales bacterium]|nr:hypothetical protein [Deinococcales bacterium]